ncbi:MAG: hypothetical protein K2K84_01065, partial [Muribaculaceae bacterium]|nr:hypothetical protein [Muribaculaceae bacterium]
MKFPLSLRPAVSLIVSLTAVSTAFACGPYYPTIPTPEFFELEKMGLSIAALDRTENLRLWQSLTSEKIPLSDIEDVVYKSSSDRLYDYFSDGGSPVRYNQFTTYVNNTGDSEVKDFLFLAKDMEERWEASRSPWHYPRQRGEDGGTDDFNDIVEYCKAYKGNRLSDRYSLQAVRALFASRRYDDCIGYCDSAFASVSDDNLMKRMAVRYAAGCWSRLGYEAKADSMFAKAGDIMSLSTSDRIGFMAGLNPDAPMLMEYIRAHTSDTAFVTGVASVAANLLKSGRVKNRGDWEFMLAHYENEFCGNPKAASAHIRRALTQSFSSDNLKDLARAYKMKLDALAGTRAGLLADLGWLEEKMSPDDHDSEDWSRRLGNIVYGCWIPRLWKEKDYATAVLLCAYVDNLRDKGSYCDYGDYDDYDFCPPCRMFTIAEARKSDTLKNPLDYSSLSFQLMGSLTSSELAGVYNKMMTSSAPMYKFLRLKIRKDSNYYNELIGTLALREENFDRAISYLSRVSPGYQRTMNIYKDGYLSRD